MMRVPQESRGGTDRRKNPTQPLSSRSLTGSRIRIRRRGDRNTHYYVDRYNPASVSAVLATMVLSLMDAFFTLWLIDLGGEELNPIMDFFLQKGPFVFLLVKYFLTALGMILVILHQHYYLWNQRVRVQYLMVLPPLCYLLLILYELRLLGLL